ncbi:MAG TPA: hypothetical protein VGJ92_04895 [Methanocella sp.]
MAFDDLTDAQLAHLIKCGNRYASTQKNCDMLDSMIDEQMRRESLREKTPEEQRFLDEMMLDELRADVARGEA